jgi:diguanylate cyclase (GGDEF)-like protein/PAS domain S-box-containing protein
MFFSTHEWFAAGVAPFHERLQDFPTRQYPWWMSGLRDRGGIRIEDVTQLPPQADAERRLLERVGVRSTIAVPLRWKGSVQGFLGLSLFAVPSVWSAADQRSLRVIAKILALALSQFDVTRSLLRKDSMLEEAERLAHLGSWSWDVGSSSARWSREVYAIYGLDPQEFTPTYSSVLARVHPDDRSNTQKAVDSCIEHGTLTEISTRIVHSNGKIRYLRVYAKPNFDKDGVLKGFVGTVQDISEIRFALSALERTNRVLKTISDGNSALVHATNEVALRREICRILVQEGGYRLAWFSDFAEEDPGSLQVSASFGEIEDSFFSQMMSIWHDGGSAPFAQALRMRKPVHLRAPAEYWSSRGLASIASFPLVFNDALYGTLEIAGERSDAFDEGVLKVLSDFAGDVAFAIGAVRTRHEHDETRRALEASEGNLRSVLERESDGIIVMDHSARILFANAAAQTMMGRRMEELSGVEFAFPVVSGESAEITLMRPDGSLILAEMRASETEWYKIPSLVLAIRDVTDQRRAEAQLRIWATVLDHSGDIIFVTDAQKRIIAVNRAFEAITGYSEHEVIGRDPHFLASRGQKPDFYRELWAVVDEVGHWQGEVEDRRKDGQPLPLWLAITAAADKTGNIQHYIGIGSDISDRKEVESRIQFLAYHDALTGLPNRVLFQDRLELAMAHAKRQGTRAAVLFLDLDRFKNINDSLGHHVGDELLKEVSVRLSHCIRADDTISRQGGDEFLVLLHHLSEPDDVAQVATKILRELAIPFPIRSMELHISGSIGIALYPDDGHDSETLIRNADAAMYYAKELGRNNFQFFVAELNARVSTRLMLENSLRRAIEREEFLLYYQPQVNARTGDVVGIEALLRWSRKGKLIQPEEFIGLAEETELIIPIGEWVLSEACRQLALWQAAGLPRTRLAVNLSAVQFQQKGAFERLGKLLKNACRDPGCIEMELTERTLMQDAETSLRYLTILKEIGVGLAVDDFGTGYSNLSYLFRFPIDRLKVDRSFVRDLPTVGADRAVTEAVIALAKSLRLAVIAEGVETAEELAALLERDCEEIQGFYFAPPLPAAEFTTWWLQRLEI